MSNPFWWPGFLSATHGTGFPIATRRGGNSARGKLGGGEAWLEGNSAREKPGER